MARSSSTARSLVTPTNAITLGKITPPLTSVNPVAISSPIDDSSACTLYVNYVSSRIYQIKFISYPYHLWGLSALLLTGASFFVYALTSATVYRIEKGYWWQYGFAVVMYALGIICIFVGEVEVFRMDRGKGTVSISKRRCYTHIIRHSCVAVYTIENGLTIAIMSSSIKYETRLLQDVVRVSVECSVGNIAKKFC
ncbi:hypothetical protein Ae201684P_008793 [Aphanomyces euteiches]|nr:hypothetical protein Ae201684P_008793 [Aphanomyces euteiches]